jgi:hypothetical protein
VLRASEQRMAKHTGFQIKRFARSPQRWLTSRLRAMLTPSAWRSLHREISRHGAGPRCIADITPLSLNHPDRVDGPRVYTHTLRVLYKPIKRQKRHCCCSTNENAQTWEMIFGITETGTIVLWMD